MSSDKTHPENGQVTGFSQSKSSQQCGYGRSGDKNDQIKLFAVRGGRCCLLCHRPRVVLESPGPPGAMVLEKCKIVLEKVLESP